MGFASRYPSYELHMRRLGTLKRCIENVFTPIPPKTEHIPDRDVLRDAQINLQAFVANVYGAIDNLAWLWVYERGLRPADAPGRKSENVRVSSRVQVRLFQSRSFREGFPGDVRRTPFAGFCASTAIVSV